MNRSSHPNDEDRIPFSDRFQESAHPLRGSPGRFGKASQGSSVKEGNRLLNRRGCGDRVKAPGSVKSMYQGVNHGRFYGKIRG